ncbi:glutathione S-transferase N-terminal domain-containing protein [Thalassococcus sp. CAU 1522]|uniref:Glutathione S-transferase N-terminal domain-containing protein n=1 Tax=Thalassococcus arenae TaxID=2851652 RepID=A0ABS6N7H2_9RHOB|nr:glutathione S-transferase N-terminal domain-containing protein [Thalassococcus arenae]MBV2359966.1 glutathione S-transferase N-terminal domain-containing protein [Thalassococcus arenae]
MTDTLFLGDYAYSSWSMRVGLLVDRFAIPVARRDVDFNAAKVSDQMLRAAPPARTVPTLVTADGAVIWDSLAIAEELASRFPDKPLWPADPVLRATARSLAAEMHSGFSALRGDCPMHLRTAYKGFQPSDAVRADLARIETIWSFALDRSGGPWLCGGYSIADACFAPVAARIATYDLPVGDTARAYAAAHLADPAFRRWRATGLVKGQTLPWYDRPFATRPWPGPEPLAARATETGTPENAACPYSGKPVAHLMETGGRVFGFCNPLCRDKTAVDPMAWPAFAALLDTPPSSL